jgi:Extracellular mutant protein 11
MNQGVKGFVAQRVNNPPSSITRREIAASLKVKQPPQRNQSHDSSRNTGSPSPGVGQKHLGHVKNEHEHVDSQHGTSGNGRFSKGNNGVQARHATRDFREGNIQVDAQGGAFDTDVSDDFDRSISDVPAPSGQRDFHERNVEGNKNGLGAHGDERLLDADDESSGSDDEGEAYARDPDQTVTINENFQMDQAAFEVPVRTKLEDQTRRGQRDGGDPRSRVLEELGSYPVSMAGSLMHPEETQYLDTTGSQLGQTMPPRKGASRARVQWSEATGSYYGSSEEEEINTTRISRTPALISRRTTPGPRIREKTHEDQLDFPQKALASMTYDQLRNQPFDTDPNAHPFVLPPDLTNTSLSSQLSYISTLPDPQRHQFFNSLSLDTWEDCGDWFVDQFASIVKRMTALRREKRKAAMEFEEEVAERQERVRVKAEGLKTVMGKMQREGKVLIEEKLA